MDQGAEADDCDFRAIGQIRATKIRRPPMGPPNQTDSCWGER